MVLSKIDIPPQAQHFLECGIEECERNCKFYCNICHQRFCKQCSEEHLKSPENKNHEVVLYQQRKRQLPVKKCRIHLTKDVDMFCEECQVPLCSICVALPIYHRGHVFCDLDRVYADIFANFQEEIYKVLKYILPKSQLLKQQIEENISEIKYAMVNIIRSIRNEGKTLKSLVDTVIYENIELLENFQVALSKMGCSIEKCEGNCEFYCNPCHQRLCKQCKDVHLKSSDYKNHEVVLYQHRKTQIPLKKCKIHPTKDVDMLCKECQVPVCSKCATGEDHRGHIFLDISELDPVYAKLFEYLQEKISIDHMYFLHVHIPTSQEKENEKDSSKIKHIIDNIRKSMESEGEYFKILVDRVVSENLERLEQIEHSLLEDLKNQDKTIDDYIIYLNNLVKELRRCLSSTELQKLMSEIKNSKTRPIPEVTKLVTPSFIAGQYSKNDIIQLLVLEEFIKTGNWRPLSIHSSHINGDLLVGKKIQRDVKGQELYNDPHYITENINGDICTSDKETLVVVNKSGDHMFSYTGQGSMFRPSGICKNKCDEEKVTRYQQNRKRIIKWKYKNENVGQELYNDPHYITENINGDQNITMALSKVDIPNKARHVLKCGVEECENNFAFYCKPCQERFCKHCRDEHQKIPENTNHEVVLYKHRKGLLHLEKCKIHPT
ncbi:uncharacterized protein LOC134266961 [Saccostrea cucullata]|uniref:uncharacterized protein LOC134266961 n=1 Tax=Saccostrea cuccullata TaxID=36930 RepID=UPI002ED2E608